MTIGTPIIHSMHYAASPLADRYQPRYRAGADEPRTGATTDRSEQVFKIEKNIEISSRVRGVIKYPFAQMDVGDSFSAPHTAAANIRAAAFSFGKRSGFRFSTRKDGDQVRVWRIA